MKCIVCDNNIRIDTLKQLFALNSLLLCSCCSQNLIPKSEDVLYDDNEWIRIVIGKLNQGDIALTSLFKNRLQKSLAKKRTMNSKIKIIEAEKDPQAKGFLPYPWLEILIECIELEMKWGNLDDSAEIIVVAVEKYQGTQQGNADSYTGDICHQIAIIG
jgi:hypothetical protein